MSNPVVPTIGKRGAAAHVPQAGFNRTEFFSLDDGETGVLRFLTDYEPVTVNGELVGGWPAFLQHQNIPTKAQPADYKGKWPGTMPANCRRDPQFGDAYGECFICDVIGPALGSKYKKPAQRYYALAVVREAVKEDGRIVGYRDKTVDVTRKGKDGEEDKTTKEKALVIVNMAWKNFFTILNGYGSAYGTVLDRDYQITRQGSGLETSYVIIPLNTVSDELDGQEVPFDLRIDGLMARYLSEAAEVGYAQASDNRLIEVIAERASDDFYGRFFDSRVTVAAQSAPQEESGGTGGVVPATATAPGADSAVDESVARLVSRIQGAGAAAYTPQAESAPEQVPAAAVGGRNFS